MCTLMSLVCCVGTFKQEQGTGLGDGDTADAQDVSHQIENEDQIMGAQQDIEADDREADKDGSKSNENQADDAEGVEMEEKFDGELHDGELEQDEEQDDAAEVCFVHFGVVLVGMGNLCCSFVRIP